MFVDKLKAIGACDDAIAWVGNKTAQEAWDVCEERDWMIWLLLQSELNPGPLIRLLIENCKSDTITMHRLERALTQTNHSSVQAWNQLYCVKSKILTVDMIRKIYPNVPEL